jgi:hypothetical protein
MRLGGQSDDESRLKVNVHWLSHNPCPASVYKCIHAIHVSVSSTLMCFV